jgi:hypothetical protein
MNCISDVAYPEYRSPMIRQVSVTHGIISTKESSRTAFMPINKIAMDWHHTFFTYIAEWG